MHKTEKYIYGIVGIILTAVIVAGISYAYFMARITGQETDPTVVIKSQDLELTYTDGKEIISPDNIAPGWSNTKTFSIKNTGNSATSYNINFNNVTNTFVNKNDLVYTLTSTNGGGAKVQTALPSTDTIVLSNINIAPTVTQTYTITISYLNTASNQSADIGKNFDFKIFITPGNVVYLMKNGYGEELNNTNFSQFTFDSNEKYNGALGSYKLSGNSVLTKASDEYIPVDTNKEYIISADIKSNGNAATHYVGFAEFDIDKKEIGSHTVMYIANTLTTLTQDLKNGDTVVYLNNINAWLDASSTPTHQLGFIFWNYRDSIEYLYPELTYSRNVWLDLYLYTGINKGTNTITLKVPWNKGTITAGTNVSQSNAGAAFRYVLLGGQTMPASWTSKQAIVSSFKAGTKYIKFYTYFNHNSTPATEAWYTNINFYEKK